MKNKKGFTLIELLAVILILGIIALIAIPTVTKVIKESKKGSFETAVKNVVKAVELECQMEQMRNEDLTTTYNFVDGKVDQNLDVKGKLPKSGIIVVDESCKIAVDVSDGEFIAKKELDSDKIVITEENTKASYKAYSVGDEVTLSDGTTWIVVKESTKNENEIKLMSMLNIKNNLTTETGTEMFTTVQSEYEIAYDNSGNNSNIWENSTLKLYLDNIVKSRLESSLGTTISNITIWGFEEVTTLGCEVGVDEGDSYYCPVCDKTVAWYSRIFENVPSWTKMRHAGYRDYGGVWSYYSSGFGEDFNDGGFGLAYADGSNNRGIRPIITVSKTVITK